MDVSVFEWALLNFKKNWKKLLFPGHPCLVRRSFGSCSSSEEHTQVSPLCEGNTLEGSPGGSGEKCGRCSIRARHSEDKKIILQANGQSLTMYETRVPFTRKITPKKTPAKGKTPRKPRAGNELDLTISVEVTLILFRCFISSSLNCFLETSLCSSPLSQCLPQRVRRRS